MIVSKKISVLPSMTTITITTRNRANEWQVIDEFNQFLDENNITYPVGVEARNGYTAHIDLLCVSIVTSPDFLGSDPVREKTCKTYQKARRDVNVDPLKNIPGNDDVGGSFACGDAGSLFGNEGLKGVFRQSSDDPATLYSFLDPSIVHPSYNKAWSNSKCIHIVKNNTLISLADYAADPDNNETINNSDIAFSRYDSILYSVVKNFRDPSNNKNLFLPSKSATNNNLAVIFVNNMNKATSSEARCELCIDFINASITGENSQALTAEIATALIPAFCTEQKLAAEDYALEHTELLLIIKTKFQAMMLSEKLMKVSLS